MNNDKHSDKLTKIRVVFIIFYKSFVIIDPFYTRLALNKYDLVSIRKMTSPEYCIPLSSKYQDNTSYP